LLIFSAGTGKHFVSAKVQVLDKGLTIILCSGEHSHVGSVVVAVPRPSLQDSSKISTTSSVINLVGHKDEEVARPLAEKVAKICNQTVVVVAGIHVEKATSEDIGILSGNVEDVAAAMIRKLDAILG